MKTNIRMRHASMPTANRKRVNHPVPATDSGEPVWLSLAAIALCIAAAVIGYGLMP